jgi:predicted NUDIX family phosphoesterase
MLVQRSTELENDTDLLQVVTYGVVSYETDGSRRTFVYCRGKSGNEDRLYRKLSLGIGGHVNRDDVLLGKDTIVRSAMRRELKEELGLTPVDDHGVTPTGILFDSSVQAGVTAVHLGQVFDILVSEGDIDASKIESACEVVGWLTDDEIRAMYFTDPFEFEDWSRWTIQGTLLKADEALTS